MKNLNNTASILDAIAKVKNWQNDMTPGEGHKVLEKINGSWNEDISLSIDPDLPATTSNATAEAKMILNGLYQQVEHKGSINEMPYEAMSIIGFDNAKKLYSLIWADNLGSDMLKMSGRWDETTESINFEGSFADSFLGSKIGVRIIMHFSDSNAPSIEMYETLYNRERQTMKMKLSKKESAATNGIKTSLSGSETHNLKQETDKDTRTQN